MDLQNRTAIYIRVSTAGQKTDLQKNGLFEYLKRAGLIFTKEYIDIAVSGRNKKYISL